MDFKKMVIHEVDTKYQEMANGTTEEPFAKTPTVNPNHVYAQKRDDYYNRLKCENAEFNKAANQIIRTRNERLRAEEARRKDKERKRAEQNAVAKKLVKAVVTLAIIGGGLAALIGLVIWPKMIYPNMDADSLYTPEILQSYSGSYNTGRIEGDAVVTFTSCSQSGKLSGYFEFFVGNTYGKYEISGQIFEKKNSENLQLSITSGPWIHHPTDYVPLDKMTVEIIDNYQSFVCSRYDMRWTVGANDDYVIETVNDLQKLAGSEATYQLKNDIDLSGVNWKPIGGFDGTLIGNGYTIRNLTINSSSSNVGFFITLGGIVKDIKFENVNITVSGTHENIGALCGKLKGTVINVSVSGNIVAENSNYVGGIAGYIESNENSTFTGISNEANVSGADYVGGIAGANIINSSCSVHWAAPKNTGNISGNNYVGGLFGYSKGINSSYLINVVGASNESNISADSNVGCIIGRARCTTINNCTNNGSVLTTDGYITENGTKLAYVGGYVGYTDYAISNCVNTVEINYTGGGQYVGGIAGYIESDTNFKYTGLSNEASISGADYVGGIAGANIMDSSCSVDWVAPKNTGNISGNNYVGGLFGRSKGVNTGFLINVIDGSNKSNITASSNVGCIVGQARYTVIKNCSNDGSTLTANGYITESGVKVAYVGGYVGYTDYSISDCVNKVAINYTGGGQYVGGIAGYIKSNINFKYTGLSNEASISGADYVGGIAGANIMDSSCNVEWIASKNVGNINGNNYVGGLFGYSKGYNNSYSIKIIDAAASGNTRGKTNFGSIVGAQKYTAIS